ncbi:unnamed protein product [Staurois parvus]|uniref:Uncharacterized protein n=1 Tax=Staurois parvus TaxID=386267 RepID=A0ABN9EFQ1_9NEOB|nr:unnamed protein product [Staurois parvus]
MLSEWCLCQVAVLLCSECSRACNECVRGKLTIRGGLTTHGAPGQ